MSETSYAVLGIEDLGVQLEEPFNILPLRQYSDGMFADLTRIERSYRGSSSSSTAYVLGRTLPPPPQQR